MRKILLATLLLAAGASARQKDTVFTADYGIRPHTYADMTGRFRQVLEDCKGSGAKVLVLEEGRYDFWPEEAVRRDWFISNTSSEEECPSKTKTVGLLLDGMQDLVIEGNGATLMFHGKMTMLALDRCRNITLHNLYFDFERPGGSELTYAKADEDGVEVALHRDSRYEIVDGRIRLFGEGWQSEKIHCIEYDPSDGRFFFSDGWSVLAASPAVEIAPGIVRFATPPDFRPRIGNTLTVRDIIRDQVGMFFLQSEGITLEDIGVRYMHGLGIVSQYSKDITMRRVDCSPREGSGRLLASSADFMHFSGCSGKIRILGCRFAGAQDDPINVHGTNLRVIAKTGRKSLLLKFMHAQSYGFDAFFPGDTAAFVKAATLQRIACATVKSVKRRDDRTVEVTFDRPVPDGLETGLDCVENLTCTPEVEIRNCFFTRTSTRGTLMTTPRKVVIADNVYCKTGMSAILIESDAEGWYESGPVKDVLIQGNTFIGCAWNGGPSHAVIAINPSNTVVDPEKPVHENIRIIGNTFRLAGNPVLFAKSTGGLVFRDNEITEEDGSAPSGELFIIKGCKDPLIEGPAPQPLSF